MNSFLSASKVTSLLTTLTACLGLALGSTGCLVDDDATFTTSDPTEDIAVITVDPGAALSSTPGTGAGVFVQYAAGGHWTVFTTCDTDVTAGACNFDVLVSADASATLDNVEGTDLSPDDTLTLREDGSIDLVTETADGSDGMTFDADPGAGIELDVLLDGVPQPSMVFVVSDGAVVDGVPTNPVDFVPGSP